MVWASGYANAKVTTTWANSKPERSGVAKVKWRPALGSSAQKTLAVPQRSYSLSRRASRPGTAGEAGRTSACKVSVGMEVGQHPLVRSVHERELLTRLMSSPHGGNVHMASDIAEDFKLGGR